MLANKVEDIETGQQSFGNAGGEKLFARVAELVEDQHEEDAHAVPYEELQEQHWGTDIEVEVSSVNVPEEQQEGVLHQPHDVVHGHAVPVLGLADQVGVAELHLRRRPAEHVNAGVQEREQAQDYGSAHPAQLLLYVLRKRRLAEPEDNPRVEEETQEIEQHDEENPDAKDWPEKHQHRDARGDLEAPPHEYAEVGSRFHTDIVVIILYLNGQDVAA